MREPTLWAKLHAIAEANKPKPIKLRQTKTAKLARQRLMRHLEGFRDDAQLWWKVQREVPEAWATIDEDVEVSEPKVKVTLYLDQSVVKLFKSMGRGWQGRVNRVLAAYAQMRISEVMREQRGLPAILQEYGLPVPDELSEWYLEHRDRFEGLKEAEQNALDIVFGVVNTPGLDKTKDAG